MTLTSEYVIDLEFQDKSKDAIRAIEKELKNIGDIAKKAASGADMSKNLEKTKDAADAMIKKIDKMSKDTTLDLDALVGSYAKNSQKAVDALEAQYAKLKDERNKLTDELKQQKKAYDEMAKRGGYEAEEAKRVYQINVRLHNIKRDQLENQIRQNREIRASLVESAQQARANAALQKYKDLQAKREAATNRAEKKALDEKIKQQKTYIKAIEMAVKVQKNSAKQQELITKAIKESENAQSRLSKFGKKARNFIQTSYNVTGMIGGAGRLMSGGIRAASSGLNMVSQASDRALERERAVNRVKGMDAKTADELLGKIYVQTGADYSTIVEAINRVRGVIKGRVSDDDLAQAAAIEIRYPGLSTAFASQNMTQLDAGNFRRYASTLNDIQKATGASTEQIAASTQVLANRKDIQNTGGKVSDYQAVYLAMQNSGAFESEDELESVFSTFVRKQKNSGKDVFEFAKDFKMADYVYDAQNKQQAMIADQHLDWQSISEASRKYTDSEANPEVPEKTAAEKTAEKMRALEEKRNEMMIKLVDVLEPIIDAISKVITDGKMDKIIEGAVTLLSNVVPLLSRVLASIGEFIVWITTKLTDYFDDDDDVKNGAAVIGAMGNTANKGLILKNANGGLALMPSIVGERGPEAIIPLDFARSQRASNIATSINQTFNMGSNATTALSLAQTVRSRDFTRAMAENAFITRRCGVF